MNNRYAISTEAIAEAGLLLLPACSATIREPQECDLLRFSIPSGLPVLLGIAPDLDQPNLSGCTSKPNWASVSPDSFRKRLASLRCSSPARLGFWGGFGGREPTSRWLGLRKWRCTETPGLRRGAAWGGALALPRAPVQQRIRFAVVTPNRNPPALDIREGAARGLSDVLLGGLGAGYYLHQPHDVSEAIVDRRKH